MTGQTDSTDFPTTAGALDTTYNGNIDGFVIKLTSAGTLAYSTFLGASGLDYGQDISVDGSGAIYVTGTTGSSTFPSTSGAYDTTLNGSNDVFITKLTSTGTLTYSTFLGGSSSDTVGKMFVDGSGTIYLAGITSSSSFPTTVGAYDTSFNGSNDAYVTKLSMTSGLVYSTFLGTSGSDWARSIAVDGSGAIYVAGETQSSTFPTTVGAYDTSFNGSNDAFVTKLTSAGALNYSTFLGGSNGESVGDMVVDGSGVVHLVGTTDSSTYPTTVGAYDTSFNGFSDVFVTKLSTTSGLVYSTFIGGSNADIGRGIVVDGAALST